MKPSKLMGSIEKMEPVFRVSMFLAAVILIYLLPIIIFDHLKSEEHFEGVNHLYFFAFILSIPWFLCACLVCFVMRSRTGLLVTSLAIVAIGTSVTLAVAEKAGKWWMEMV